jgi:hypothetical protein
MSEINQTHKDKYLVSPHVESKIVYFIDIERTSSEETREAGWEE